MIFSPWLLAPLSQVEPAIETYERILRVVPDHKEAVDSLLFLRGRPKGAPLRDDLPGLEGERNPESDCLIVQEQLGRPTRTPRG